MDKLKQKKWQLLFGSIIFCFWYFDIYYQVTLTPQEQYYRAYNYEHGKTGYERDRKKAEIWYLRSARRGNVSAQATLGFIYSNGLFGEKNHQKACKWYSEAAKQDYFEYKWLARAHC